VLDPKVFKAYDVRGLYGSELDEEGAYAIGRAYVERFEPASDAPWEPRQALHVHGPTRLLIRLTGRTPGRASI